MDKHAFRATPKCPVQRIPLTISDPAGRPRVLRTRCGLRRGLRRAQRLKGPRRFYERQIPERNSGSTPELRLRATTKEIRAVGKSYRCRRVARCEARCRAAKGKPSRFAPMRGRPCRVAIAQSHHALLGNHGAVDLATFNLNFPRADGLFTSQRDRRGAKRVRVTPSR